MRASNYAGKAINITATTAAHAMSYKVTTIFGIPHGHAVAVCMRYVWEHLINNDKKCTDTRGREYLKHTLDSIQSLISLGDFHRLMENLGMQYPISYNKASQLEILTKSVNPVRLKNYPVSLNEKEIKDIYERIIRNES